MFRIVFWALNALNCKLNEDYVSLKISEISYTFSNDLVFKNFLPVFYNFKGSIDITNLIFHYKNLFEKTIDKKLIDIVINEFRKNTRKFDEKIMFIVSTITNIKSYLFKARDKLSIYRKLELFFFSFFYDKINTIINYYHEDESIKKILNQDVINIFNLIKSINNFKKRNLQFFKSDESINRELIFIVKEILPLLSTTKKKLFDKINENCILKETCIEYLKNHETSINLTDYCWIQNFNITVEEKQKIIEIKYKEFDKILCENIKLETINCRETIKKNLFKLIDCVYIISKINFLELKIDCFLNILVYCNYIRDKIYLNFVEEINSTIQTDLIQSNQEKIHNFKIFSEFIHLKKKLLNNLITDFSLKGYKTIFVDPLYKIQRFKCIVLQHYINLEKLNDDFLNSISSSEHFAEQEPKMFNMCDEILKNFVKNSFLCTELFNKDFTFFKLHCISVFILKKLHFWRLRTYKIQRSAYFSKLLSILINSYNNLLCKDKDFESKNDNNNIKLFYLSEIIKEYTKIDDYIKQTKGISFKKKTENNNKIFLLSEVKFHINFYEVIANKKNILYSKISNSQITDDSNNCIMLQNIKLKAINSSNPVLIENENIYRYKTCKYLKLKKRWEIQWKIHEP
ncbi:hypothetical protein NUSPORA_01260 [Nucleospora cyclopteri]